MTPPLERATLAIMFEGAPRFLDRLAAAGPLDDAAALFERARSIAHAMPEPEQLELIDAHPRLGAPPGSVSPLSFAEQGYDRPEVAAESERARIAAELDRLNDAYEARHGFRYCVFVAGRSRHELIPELAAAVDADRATEIGRAIDAVVDIAIDRHAKLVASTHEADR